MIRLISISVVAFCLFVNEVLAVPTVTAQAYQGEPFVANVTLTTDDVKSGVQIRLANRSEYSTLKARYPEFLDNALVLRSKRNRSQVIIRALQPASSLNFDLIICRILNGQEEFYLFNVSVTGSGTEVSDAYNVQRINTGQPDPVSDLSRLQNKQSKNYSDQKSFTQGLTVSDTPVSPENDEEQVSESIAKIRALQSELQVLKSRSETNKPQAIGPKEATKTSKSPAESKAYSPPENLSPPIPPTREIAPNFVQSSGPDSQPSFEKYYSSGSLRLEDIQSHTEIVVLKLALAICVLVLFALGLLTLYHCISRRFDKNDNLIELIKEYALEKTTKANAQSLQPYPYAGQQAFNQFSNIPSGQPNGFPSSSIGYANLGLSVESQNPFSQSLVQTENSVTGQNYNQDANNGDLQQNRSGPSTANTQAQNPDFNANTTSQSNNNKRTAAHSGLRTASDTRISRANVLKDDNNSMVQRSRAQTSHSPSKVAPQPTGAKPPATSEPTSAPLSEEFQLAIVYQNMGDLGMARTVLHKIIAEGAAEEKSLAQEALTQIDKKS